MGETKFTNREQRLLTFLPAALVLVVYSFLIALPKQRIYQNKQNQLELTRQKSIDQSVAQQSEANLRLARDGLNRLKARLAADRLSIKERSQDWRNLDSRLDTVEQLTEMMVRYNLIVVSQNYQDEPKISEYMLSLFREINAESPLTPPVEYWQIELEGGYNEIQSFLTAIDRDDIQTIPIALDMTASESSNGIHMWTIIFVV